MIPDEQWMHLSSSVLELLGLSALALALLKSQSRYAPIALRLGTLSIGLGILALGFIYGLTDFKAAQFPVLSKILGVFAGTTGIALTWTAATLSAERIAKVLESTRLKS